MHPDGDQGSNGKRKPLRTKPGPVVVIDCHNTGSVLRDIYPANDMQGRTYPFDAGSCILLKIPPAQKDEVADQGREHTWRIRVPWSIHKRDIPQVIINGASLIPVGSTLIV